MKLFYKLKNWYYKLQYKIHLPEMMSLCWDYIKLGIELEDEKDISNPLFKKRIDIKRKINIFSKKYGTKITIEE